MNTIQPTLAGIGPSCSRPDINDKTILREAMRKLYDKSIKNCQFNWLNEEENDEDVIYQLVESYDIDGYTFARTLEINYYWTGDSNLVDVLDSAYYMLKKVYDEKVKQWYQDNYFELHPIGTKAKIIGPKYSGLIGKSVTIETHYEELACYGCKENGEGGLWTVNHEDISITNNA